MTIVNQAIHYFIFLLVLTYISEASTMTLKTILKSASKHNVIAKSLRQDELALQSKNLAETASDPLVLYGEGTITHPELGDKGYEYAIGISKNIKLGNIQAQEKNVGRLLNEARLLESQSFVLNFHNTLINLYHQYCIDLQSYKSLKQNYNDLIKLYKKKQKAYRYHEISKTELLQLESEKNRLDAQLQKMKMLKSINKKKVFMLSKVRYSAKTRLSCKDLYPIRTTVKLGDTFRLSKGAYEKQLASTKERIKRYSHTLESIDVSAEYGKELNFNLYTIGVSVPLSFTSKRSEYEKATAMYRYSALEYGYEQKMREKQSMLIELQLQLKSHAIMVNNISENYRNYKKSVLPLIKKSYDLGETSVIEYLLNRQKLYALAKELYVTKKAYYNTLFRLYTMSEKDIKND